MSESRDPAPPRRKSTGAAICAVVALSLLSCGSPNAPSDPVAASKVVIDASASTTGGAVVIPSTYTYNEIGGVVLPLQSGLLSARVTLSLARAATFGQVSIYLLNSGSSTEYCGQNSPDSPTWRNLPAGWTTTYTITGFQVYRLPCAVTGLRVLFHSRDNPNLLLPPQGAEVIAETTLPTSFLISLQR